MENYLHIQAGRYHLLLDAMSVHEILEPHAEDAGAAAGHRLWRDKALRVASCRELLGEAPRTDGEGVTVVYAVNEEPLLLDADRVVGLKRICESEWVAAPPLPEAVERLFDRVCTDFSTGGLLYRLKM